MNRYAMIRSCCLYTLIIFVVSLSGQAQNRGEVRAYYGIAESGFLTFRQVEGTTGYSIENYQEFGIRYIHHTITNLSLASGIHYLQAEVAVRPAPSPQSFFEITTEQLHMISVPLLLHFRLGRYFFVNGGPMLDIQLTDNTHDLQSGIALSLGIGAHYAIDHFTLFLNPHVKSHALLPFEGSRYHQRLMLIGLQAGVGYQF